MAKVYLLGKTVPTYGKENIEKLPAIAGRIDIFNESFGLNSDMDNENISTSLETIKKYRESLYKQILNYVNFTFRIFDLNKKTITKINSMFKNTIFNYEEMLIHTNAEELNSFFRVACCSKLGIEINDVADQMLDICLAEAPNLFKDAGAPCTFEKCDKKDSCGKKKQGKIKQIIKTY